MAPPAKPEKAVDASDLQDVLAGGIVNLQDEENFLHRSHRQTANNSFNSQQSFTSSGHSFSQYPPGSGQSFYGAGPANQIPEHTSLEHDAQAERLVNEQWHNAAHAVARSREHEVRNQFLHTGFLRMKVNNVSHENGLIGHGGDSKWGSFTPITEYEGNVPAQTVIGPEGHATMVTNGAFLPANSPLVDQIALLSLATEQRIRDIVNETYKLVKARRSTSHGKVPETWADMAAGHSGRNGSVVDENAPRVGWESTVSPRTMPLKRMLC